MSAMVVDLPQEVSDRLNELSERTGRSTTEYVVEAVTEHLGELEDLYLAEERLTKHRAGLSQSFDLDEVEKRLGLED